MGTSVIPYGWLVGNKRLYYTVGGRRPAGPLLFEFELPSMDFIEKKTETTIVYWGYIEIMEKKMETTIYNGII